MKSKLERITSSSVKIKTCLMKILDMSGVTSRLDFVVVFVNYCHDSKCFYSQLNVSYPPLTCRLFVMQISR